MTHSIVDPRNCADVPEGLPQGCVGFNTIQLQIEDWLSIFPFSEQGFG
jgi:hypothetical protein